MAVPDEDLDVKVRDHLRHYPDEQRTASAKNIDEKEEAIKLNQSMDNQHMPLRMIFSDVSICDPL